MEQIDAFVRQLRRAAVGVVCSSMMLGASLSARAQQGFFTREDVIKYTPTGRERGSLTDVLRCRTPSSIG